MSFYRIQSPARPATDILKEENQLSLSWDGDDEKTRIGISACYTREDLATYIAQTGIEFRSDWVLVEFDGDYSEDEDVDAHLGAILTIPTEIIAVTPIADDFELEICAAFDELFAA